LKLLDGLVLVDSPVLEPGTPVRLDADPAAPHRQHRPGFELLDPLPSRDRSREILEQQKAIRGKLIEPAVAERRMATERRHLGGKDELALGHAPVKRLLTKPVAHQVQRARRAVAIGEREHAVDALDGAPHPIATDQLEQDLSIRAVAQRDARGAKLLSQRAIAVDLAVESQGVTGFLVDTRLSAAGEIDNCEPRVAERDAAVDKDAVTVWPAMGQGAVHCGEDAPRLTARRGKPRYAAHTGTSELTPTTTTGETPPSAVGSPNAAPLA
jgi:hypothetical protein